MNREKKHLTLLKEEFREKRMIEVNIKCYYPHGDDGCLKGETSCSHRDMKGKLSKLLWEKHYENFGYKDCVETLVEEKGFKMIKRTIETCRKM